MPQVGITSNTNTNTKPRYNGILSKQTKATMRDVATRMDSGHSSEDRREPITAVSILNTNVLGVTMNSSLNRTSLCNSDAKSTKKRYISGENGLVAKMVQS